MHSYFKKITHLPLIFIVTLGIMFSMVPAFVGAPASADDAKKCGSGDTAVRTSFDFGCPGSTSTKSKELAKNPIYVVLLFIINTMAVGVGVVVAGSIIWQSIQYASANGSPDKVKSARNGIVNAVIGLLLFLFMYSILNFIIPGGIFS